MDNDKSAYVIAFMACALSGAVIGLITGWLIWG